MAATDSLATPSPADRDALRSCWLGPTSEETLLKAGLEALSEAIGKDGLLEFPRRANGTPLVTRQGFFERLLRGEATLQNCASADASAAQTDVKHLSLKQLLAIRCGHLDLVPTGAGQTTKASFIRLVDRCTVELLLKRLLGEDSKSLPENQKALLARHVTLIYAASKEIAKDEQAVSSDWWLLAVGGQRQYLHLPGCKLNPVPPSGPAWCYRSHTAPNPRDPVRSRSFRWLMLLVQEPGNWTEDPLATEQCTQNKKPLTDAKAKAVAPTNQQSDETPKGEATPCAQESGSIGIFGNFDVEELFDEFDADKSEIKGSSPEGGVEDASTPEAGAPADIDDFFDSLLAEPLFDGQEDKKGPSTKEMAKAAENTAGTKSLDVTSLQQETAEAPKSTATNGETPGDTTTITTANEATSIAQDDDEGPPKDAAEARLRSVLEVFYRERKNSDKLGNVARIARRYSGDGVIGLWAALGAKYSLAPASVVQWLAKTLDPHIAVQWPKNSVPQGAQDVLHELAEKCGELEGSHDKHVQESMQCALDKGDDAAAAVLGFLGCKDAQTRAVLWRSLLKLSSVKDSDSCMGQAERQSSYEELRAKVTKHEEEAASKNPQNATESNAAADSAAMRAEIEADARAAWKGEAFLDRPEVMGAIVNMVRTHAWQGPGFFRGSCEIAVLLLYVMEANGTVNLAVAEADAFWCLSQVMTEVQDAVAADSSLVGQIRRTHALLQAYDMPLAELLTASGLVALPAQRLGAALCARAGFTLDACAQIWDVLLSDPQRFELCDYVVLALLLLSHGDLLQHDSVGGLAETLLAAPRTIDVDTLLSTTRAICAFERRLGIGGSSAYPPRASPAAADNLESLLPSGGSIDAAVSVAHQRLSSLWGKVRAAGAEAWEAGRTAAQSEVAQAWASAAASAAEQAATAAATAADRAASAAAVAATRASAVLETRRTSGSGGPTEAGDDQEQDAPPSLVEAPSTEDDGPPQLVKLDTAVDVDTNKPSGSHANMG